MSPSMEARIAEYAAVPTSPSLPPSTLLPWSSPLPQIPSPPLPPLPSSPLLPLVPASLMLPSPQLPPLLSSSYHHLEDIPEAELPHRKRLCLTTPTSRYEVRESLTVSPRPTGGHRRVDALVEDRQYHYETARLLDQEALASREAWAHSVGLSSVVYYEIQGYRTHTWIQDHRINAQESLTTALIAHVSSLQGQLSAALG
ncbi:hypothetical protein Tco_0998356 [Tanacetum coccineum]